MFKSPCFSSTGTIHRASCMLSGKGLFPYRMILQRTGWRRVLPTICGATTSNICRKDRDYLDPNLNRALGPSPGQSLGPNLFLCHRILHIRTNLFLLAFDITSFAYFLSPPSAASATPVPASAGTSRWYRINIWTIASGANFRRTFRHSFKGNLPLLIVVAAPVALGRRAIITPLDSYSLPA